MRARGHVDLTLVMVCGLVAIMALGLGFAVYREVSNPCVERAAEVSTCHRARLVGKVTVMIPYDCRRCVRRADDVVAGP